MDVQDAFAVLGLIGALVIIGAIIWKIWQAYRAKNYFPLAVGFGVLSLGAAFVLNTATLSVKHIPPPDPGTNVSPAHSAKIELLEREVKGSVAASAPTSATQYKPFLVEMRIAPNALPSVFSSSAASAAAGSTVVGKDDIWLAREMEGGIYGDGFTFEPKDKQFYSQVVTAHEPTIWVWQATPLDSGPLTLVLRLGGKFKFGDDESASRDLYSQSFQITVDVNPEGFFKRNWKELSAAAGGAFGAVIGGLWAYFKWWKPAPSGRVGSASPVSAPMPSATPSKKAGRK